MEQSQAEWDIYSGNIAPYVIKKISDRFGNGLAKTVPLVSSINIFKKTVDTKSALYRNNPERTFTELDESQIGTVDLIYKDMSIDAKMLQSNRLYEAQKEQTHVLIEPVDGVLKMRPIKAHQVNVIPSSANPEKAEAYIFSSFDKSTAENRDFSDQNGTNEEIADVDDYKAGTERYIVWSNHFHFVMDGNGTILINGEAANEGVNFNVDDVSDVGIPKQVANELGVMPIVEITGMKDFVYWRQETNDVAEFTIDFNQDMSMSGQIVEQQGFAQAVMIGPKDMLSQEVITGPTRIVHVITDPNLDGKDSSDFKFANPGADLSGVMKYYESKLALFLSSQGVDPAEVSGNATSSKGFSSGVERLLSLVSKFEASKETMNIFEHGESGIYKIVKAWHNHLKGTDQLKAKYQTKELSEDSELNIKYKEPSAVLTETEKEAIAVARIDNGLWSKKKALTYLDGIDEDAAEKLIKEADEESLLSIPTPNIEVQ